MPADQTLPSRSALAHHWTLDPDVVFLNHGSYGACPIGVQEIQREFRDRMEREPVQFFARDLEGLLDSARQTLSSLLSCDPAGLGFVPNATAGVNAVVRSMRFEPGDQLLTTSHEYNACNNVLRWACDRWGCELVVADVPFPLHGPDDVTGAISAALTDRTRLALVSHVTSPSAVVFPIEAIARVCESRSVPLLVDGAHAPGMVELDIGSLGVPFYTGNCHKWICAPKGAGFLHVREDWRERIRPAIISHAYNTRNDERSKFHQLFDWTGTGDPTPYLSVPAALESMRSIGGSWEGVRRHNAGLVRTGRDALCAALGVEAPVPDAMLGSIATVPLPDSDGPAPKSSLYADALQDALKREWGVQVPVIPWPSHPSRCMRISAQLYNAREEYDHLASALRSLL